MSEAAPDRYLRHRAIPGFSQERLQALRVAVLGAGALGNELVKNLCLLGVGAIDLYDFDNVELHNLTRSILLRADDVGKPKAAAVAARAAAIDPAVRVRAVAGDLFETLGPVTLQGCDFALGALDNFEARIRLNRLCHLSATPWINAAIDSRHVSVESFPMRDAAACYECGLPDSVYLKLARRQSCGGLAAAAREQGVMPTTAITASLAAAYAVSQGLTLAKSAAVTRRWLLDSESGAARSAQQPRREGCPGCGDGRPRRVERIAAATGADLAAQLRRRCPDADYIELSDPLILSAVCARCGETAATAALPGRAARRVDAGAMFCFGCGAEAVRMEIVDALALEALETALAARNLQLSYVRAGDTLFDLTPGPEDGHG